MPDEFVQDPFAAANDTATGTLNENFFEGVQDLGDTFPVGTYLFEKVATFHNVFPARQGKEDEYLGDQPQYSVQVRCVEGPFAGKTFFIKLPWINQTTVDLAQKGDQIAIKTKNWRLREVIALAKTLRYPMKDFSIDKFIADFSRVKISLALNPKKTRNEATGQLENTGEMQNKILKFISPDAV